MNERIRELIKQCTSWSDGSTWTSREVFDKEKFAELVVRECAKSAIDLESIPDWYQDSVTMIPHHCSKNILKHFGVEE